MANHDDDDQKQYPSVQPSGKVYAPIEGEPGHAHEGTDVSIAPLVMTLIGFVVLAAFVLGLSYAIFFATENPQERAQSAQSNVKVQTSGPPEPRIQGIPGFHGNSPVADMDEFRVRNDQLLTHYVAAEDGHPARIPVARAMELALEHQTFKTAAPTSRPAAYDASKGTGVPQPQSTNPPTGKTGETEGSVK